MYKLENNAEDFPVKIGSPAPDFSLPTEKGVEWRLSNHLGNVTVLLFYPKNETLVCTKQLCSVRDYWEDYLKTKAVVVGISPGTSEENLQFSSNHNLPLPLLTDRNREVTKIYGQHWLFPINFTRAVLVIDAKGTIRAQKIMLRAFRPTDKEVLSAIRSARSDAMIHWA